jgi:hypothetical protein
MKSARFEALSAAAVEIPVLRDLTPCNLGNGHFGGSYFHIITCRWKQHSAGSSSEW